MVTVEKGETEAFIALILPFVMGTVIKIEGTKLTIKQPDGKEVTVKVKNVKGIKIGDKVKVKNGDITLY